MYLSLYRSHSFHSKLFLPNTIHSNSPDIHQAKTDYPGLSTLFIKVTSHFVCPFKYPNRCHYQIVATTNLPLSSQLGGIPWYVHMYFCRKP